MRMETETEPPSCPPIYMIGQDSRGNWVVRDQSGLRGGLFVGRAEALRYIRDEAGNHPGAVVMVSGAFELDTKRPAPPHHVGVEGQRVRRVA